MIVGMPSIDNTLPPDYDEPVTLTDWGVMNPAGEVAYDLTEKLARDTATVNPGWLVISREVTYGVWRVMS